MDFCRRLRYSLALLCFASSTAAPQTVTEFSSGITPGSRPLGITAGPDGNLWFTEQGGDRIGRITPQGVVTEFSAGITPGSQPSEITIGADGNLWFTEQGGNRIGRITPNGLVTEFESAVANGIPYGIAAGSDGNVWFTNRGRGFVGRITPEGIVTQFGPNGYLDTGQITAGSDGSLWLTASSVTLTGPPVFQQWYFDIVRIDSNGQSRILGQGGRPPAPFGGNYTPSGITQGPDGNVWYMGPQSGGSLSITHMTLAGTRTSYPTNSSGPQGDGGIARGPDGNLWFTNQAALPLRGVQVFRDSIGRITPSGVVTNFAFGSPAKPADITAGPDGNVWFTYVDGSRIGRITPGGEQTDFSAGFDPDQFAIAIAPGADGNLWFTLSEGSSPGAYIGRITPTGEIKTFKIAPDFTPFDDIVAGPDGNLWLTDRGANAIKRVTPAGDVTNFGAGMTAGARPNGIARGADGNLWFTEPGIDRIAHITTAGVITEFSDGIAAGARPGAITTGADGNLWFIETADSAGNGAGIGRITPSGVVTEFTSPFDITFGRWQPMAITSGTDGYVWFTERAILSGVANGPPRIGRIGTDGEVVRFNPAVTATNGPAAITMGPDGNLWFTHPNAYSIDRISPERIFDPPTVPPEKPITQFKLRGHGNPRRITAGPDGNLWFTEPDGDRIGHITTVTMAVEFYNASLDHYFLTWMPDEIAKLDAGIESKGWARTGHSFKAYTIPQPTSVPVCRYYIPPGQGDSHFFGRDTDECSATRAKFPSLMLEDSTFMHMFLPSDGACPPNTTTIYRVFSNRGDANHRYMTDKALRDQMVVKGWLAEGDGPDRVVMCAPQ